MYIVSWKTSYLNILSLNLSLLILCTFKVTINDSFADVFEDFYIFAVMKDPFQTSFLVPYILNTPC